MVPVFAAFSLPSTGWMIFGALLGAMLLICAGSCMVLYRRNRQLRKVNRQLESRVQQSVAELDQTRKELGDEHDRLQFIFDSIPMGVALSRVRPDGTMTRWVNRAQW